MAQNCPHCGKKLTRPGDQFCTNCGTPLEESVTVHGGSLAKLIIQIPGRESREEFLTQAVTSLGRRSANMIQINSPTVSGEHATIELTRKGHTITDLDSTNGTFLNGKRITPHEPYLLASNDIIRFSDALGNSIKVIYIAPSLFAEVSEEDYAGQLFQVEETPAFIGRNPKSAITLDHPAVSWHHARLERSGAAEYAIRDLSSNNGTFVNGQQLREARLLERGDVIQIGPFNLVYQENGLFAPYSAERNFRLEAVNLQKTVYPANLLGLQDKKRPKTILQEVNLVINPREFVALVGGSGTGKTTLLKALSGQSRASSGLVLVNGDDLYDHYDLYRTMMGYVPQDDIIHQNLEVRQALRYAAQLRLPDTDKGAIEQRIDEALGKVDLAEQAHTLVRDLSGGQRKRVSIAAELLAEPWIFFLDEPTAGLDPGLDKLMMDTLRQLADEGRTIILVTHATAHIISYCDQVLFLVEGGRLAYYGPPDEALRFFQVDEFPDIYTRLSHPPAADDDSEAGSHWVERYRQSPLYQSYLAHRQSGEVARPITESQSAATGSLADHLKQFGVLSRRYLASIRHDRISLWTLLAVMPVIALLLLLISNGAALVGHAPPEITAILEREGRYTIVTQAQTLLFMMGLSATLLGIFAAAYEIIKETPIYRRERMINLQILPYFVSKFVILGGFILLQTLLFLLVVGLKVDFPRLGVITWSPLEYYLTLVFTGLASLALGLFISALVRSRDTVIYLALIAIFAQIVFSGATFELTPLTRPLSYLTISRWSLEALGVTTDMTGLNEMGQLRFEREVDFGRGIQTVVEEAPTEVDFYVNYTHTPLALVARWFFLWAHTFLWGGITIWLIKRKDEI